jgi:cephalosporin hydroxylase
MNCRQLLRLLSVSVCILACFSQPKQSPPLKPVTAKSAAVDTLPISKVDVADPAFRSRIGGFYPGSQGWLWTTQNFYLLLDPPPVKGSIWLNLDFTVPNELISSARDVTITGRVNGTLVGTQHYGKQGHFAFAWQVPPAALAKRPARVDFSLDKTWKREDGQSFGIIVISAGLEANEQGLISHDDATALARAGYDRLTVLRNARLSAEKQREMMKLFHEIPVWSEMWFENVKIEKNPLDLWMMQQMIYELQPEFIVETGTWRGGSALYWAYTLNGLGLTKSRVITVDIQNAVENAAAHPLWKKYVTFFQASSTDPKVVAQIAALVKGHKTIITLDSDHHADHVLNELHHYAPLVPSGSYLIVEDTHIDALPSQPGFGPGPAMAVETFLNEPLGKNFQRDLSREAFLMTFNPGGWLKRE